MKTHAIVSSYSAVLRNRTSNKVETVPLMANGLVNAFYSLFELYPDYDVVKLNRVDEW